MKPPPWLPDTDLECRHKRFIDFCSAWSVAYPESSGSGRVTADVMDDRLHTERIAKDRSKPLFEANLGNLPPGVFVRFSDGRDEAYLWWKGKLFEWKPAGYMEQTARRPSNQVLVLTPRSTVEVIRAGYVPDIHPSIDRG